MFLIQKGSREIKTFKEIFDGCGKNQSLLKAFSN